MILFDNFEAVKFTEENLIFVTKNSYIYYIYDIKNNIWQKNKNADHCSITVKNYRDVSKKEITDAAGGIFPEKETVFLRLCSPADLCVQNMIELLKEDYPYYMEDQTDYMPEYTIRDSVYTFLTESDILYKSYLKLRNLFDESVKEKNDNKQLFADIKTLCFDVIGRDIFKNEIGIVDGLDSSSCFWIMPVRIIDFTDTNGIYNVARMKSAEISIEEDDVNQYLTPFLYKYFDNELEANKKRVDTCFTDNKENVQIIYTSGFEWYLTHNFYTFESVMNILKDIKDTVDALACGKENEFTAKLREKRGFAARKLLYAANFSEEQIKEYNDNRPKEDTTEAELIIDFYNRFIYRMEYMLRLGKEKGYNLISFMGP